MGTVRLNALGRLRIYDPDRQEDDPGRNSRERGPASEREARRAIRAPAGAPWWLGRTRLGVSQFLSGLGVRLPDGDGAKEGWRVRGYAQRHGRLGELAKRPLPDGTPGGMNTWPVGLLIDCYRGLEIRGVAIDAERWRTVAPQDGGGLTSDDAEDQSASTGPSAA
jgi:hypothetical protein